MFRSRKNWIGPQELNASQRVSDASQMASDPTNKVAPPSDRLSGILTNVDARVPAETPKISG